MLSLSDEIRQFCSAHRLRLNTDLGQHYLIDQAALDAIVASGNVADQHVVEIGPGIGVLTRELLKTAKKVTAIEVDERVIPLLHAFTEHNASSDQLEVIVGNALKVDFPTEPYQIVANIPYHITSPLLHKAFLESEHTPTSLTLLIQREVAEKICSETDASVLSIVVRLFGTPHLVQHVPPESFLPPPKVDSSVLHIESFTEPLADPATIDEVLRLVKIAFSQKRKMLRKTLGSSEAGMQRLEAAEIDPTLRPQALGIEQWIDLARSK